MLTFTEEILLLLGDEDGLFLPVKEYAFECALAGAILMDLAFAYRIDTDLKALVVTDSTPTGNPMLDRVLDKISASAEITDTATWIRILATNEVAVIREQALNRLVNQHILERRHKRFLWMFRSVYYPTIDDEPVHAIRVRIKAVLSDDIPDPRDIALICLADACQILPSLIPEWKSKPIRSRLKLLRKMDLIGREVIGMISDIQDRIIRAARAQAVRFRKMLVTLAAAGGLVAVATLLVPRIPVPERYGFSLLELLWFDGFWKQFSGYLLLGLSIIGFVIAVIIKKQLLIRVAGSYRWRLSHLVLGIGCTLTLFVHTGFRLGANLNTALMGCYLAVLLSGAFAGVVIGGAPYLQQRGIRKTNRLRRILIGTHVLAICPLPALLIVHLLSVYLY